VIFAAKRLWARTGAAAIENNVKNNPQSNANSQRFSFNIFRIKARLSFPRIQRILRDPFSLNRFPADESRRRAPSCWL
jgi:hypothetical protein